MHATQGKPTFDFFVLGPARAGYRVLDSRLKGAHRCHLHIGLMHPDRRVRAAQHRSYFVDSGVEGTEQPFDPIEQPAEHYMSNFVFDRPLYREKSIGLQLTLSQFRDFQLQSYLQQLNQRGDFGVILLKRNPAAAFLANAHCHDNGAFVRPRKESKLHLHSAYVNPRELDEYCLNYERDIAYIEQTASYRLEIDFPDLFYPARIRKALSAFLDTPVEQRSLDVFRLTSKDWHQRIENLPHLMAECTHAKPWILELLSSTCVC